MGRKNIRNIFVSGATGFLASNLLRLLLMKKENRLYTLIRAKDINFALQRKNALIDKIFPKSMHREVIDRIIVVRGDISKDNLGLSKKDLSDLRSIHVIYHCAAICKFSHPLSEIRKVNVRGTENLLKLALDWQKMGCLENVNHVSTVYVSGNYRGIFYENKLDVSQDFNNSYELSKFEAELRVLKYREAGLRVDIYRPSIIVDTIPPSAPAIPSFLRLMAMFASEAFKEIPADNSIELNFVPIDAASKAIYLISNAKNRLPNQNYHIANPAATSFGVLLDIASGVLGFERPKCIPASKFCMNDLSPIQRRIIMPFIPYLNQKSSFDTSNASSILKQYNFRIPVISKKRIIQTFKYYRPHRLAPYLGKR